MQKTDSICFIISSLSSGGAERVVSVLASQLAKNGYHILIVKYFSAEQEYPVHEAVKTVCLAQGDEKTYHALPLMQRLFLLRRILKAEAPAYVVPFLPHVAAHVFLAGFGLRLRQIQTVRSAPNRNPPSWGLRRMRDFLTAHSFRTFVQTQAQKAYFDEKTQQNIVVLPNPVSDCMFEATPRALPAIQKIVAVGRLTEQKNFKLAVDAVAQLCAQGYDLQLSIYGDGALKAPLRTYIQCISAQHCCKLCGRSERIAEVYRENDVFLLSSNFEGMPNALMEAMACGMPCIAADCETGPAELLANERGILVPVGDVDAIKRAIQMLLDTPERAEEMGKRARAFVEREYRAERIAQRFVEEVLGESR